jgi:hypothetical protein
LFGILLIAGGPVGQYQSRRVQGGRQGERQIRRLINLKFAGWNRTVMIRRELPESRIEIDAKRFQDLKGRLARVEHFAKGTLLARMIKCGKPGCAWGCIYFATTANPRHTNGIGGARSGEHNPETVDMKTSPRN